MLARNGASNKILLFKQKKLVPIKEARDVATSIAKKPEQSGTTAVIKRRVAAPRDDA